MTNRAHPFPTLSRVLLVTRTYWRHHRYLLAGITVLIAPLFVVFTRITLLMDYLFYPELWDLPVRSPVFIVGHPRSGTSFLQRQIYATDQAAMFTTWELLFPSLVVRKAMRPLITGLQFLGVDVLQGAQSGHRIRLDDVEEEEALFLHRLDSEIVHILCPWLLLDAEIADDGFRLGWTDLSDSDRSIRLLHEFLKRQIWHTGHPQIIVKLNPSIFRLRSMLQTFPDAKLIYIIRKPQKSIRSFLSLQNRFVSHFLSLEEQEEYFQQKYQWSLALYRYFESVKQTVPKDQLLTVHFGMLVHHPKKVVQSVFKFSGIRPSKVYWQKLYSRLRSQTRKHTNPSLESFGIHKDDIIDDLDFLWDEYNL